MKSLAKVIALLISFSLIIAVLHFSIQFLFGKDPGLLLRHGAGQFTFVGLFVLMVVIFQKYVNKEGFWDLHIRPYPGFYITVLKGWAAGVLAFVFYSVIMGIFGIVEFRLKFSPLLITAFFTAFSAFAIAVTEEIIFRGFFLQTLLKDLPKWFAVLVTGIIFVAFHDLAQPWSFLTEKRQIMLAGGLFSLNILLCVAYLKSKTLWLPIGIHSGLVFGKVFFRRAKMMYPIEPADSILFGLEGDARRGILAWLLFLSGVLILNFLITKREKQAIT